MAIRKKVKKASELQYTTVKPKKLNWKFFVGLLVSSVLLGVIVFFVIKNMTVGASGTTSVPWWIIIIAFMVILYLVVYFGWKLKNWFVEWMLSMAYGLLIMVVILLVGYERILGSITVEWLKTLVGSLFVGSGGVIIGLIVKILLKPAFMVLKRTYLWEAK